MTEMGRESDEAGPDPSKMPNVGGSSVLSIECTHACRRSNHSEEKQFSISRADDDLTVLKKASLRKDVFL